VGAIVCKLDKYKDVIRGYIAMLDVDEKYRKKKIGNSKKSKFEIIYFSIFNN
jgi:N-alpha-acetyltransferase 30